MSVEDIKKSIQNEAEAKIQAILSDGQKKISEINSSWNKKLDEKRKTIVASAQKKANQKIQQTEFNLDSQIKTEISRKKQSIIDQVYKLAFKKLSELDDASYVELMEKLIGALPEEKGEVESVKSKEDLLKKALKNAKADINLSDKTINGGGGFIYRSKAVDIDCTFATLTQNANDQTILTVTAKLFGEKQ